MVNLGTHKLLVVWILHPQSFVASSAHSSSSPSNVKWTEREGKTKSVRRQSLFLESVHCFIRSGVEREKGFRSVHTVSVIRDTMRETFTKHFTRDTSLEASSLNFMMSPIKDTACSRGGGVE